MAAVSPRLFAVSDTVGATALLSAWVRSTADAAGLVGTRIEPAPTHPAPAGLIAMQVDVRAQAEIAELADWLAHLEQGDRLLRVERLDITADGGGLLAISARVRGYARGWAP
jgi:type II secretory pathway component PulM